MASPSTRRTRAVASLAAAGLAIAGLLVVSQPAQAGHRDATARAKAQLTAGRYIVRLANQPVATYDGGVRGLAATKPGAGEKVDRSATAVSSYRSFLSDQRARVLKAGRVPTSTVYTYSFAFNGFSADLTSDQAQKLAHTPGVASVTKQKHYEVDTVHTPEYLKLSGPDGLWSKVGGKKGAGKGAIVGVIDTGMWPESTAFSGQAHHRGGRRQGAGCRRPGTAPARPAMVSRSPTATTS